jgi:hypothetical protein
MKSAACDAVKRVAIAIACWLDIAMSASLGPSSRHLDVIVVSITFVIAVAVQGGSTSGGIPAIALSLITGLKTGLTGSSP